MWALRHSPDFFARYNLRRSVRIRRQSGRVGTASNRVICGPDLLLQAAQNCPIGALWRDRTYPGDDNARSGAETQETLASLCSIAAPPLSNGLMPVGVAMPLTRQRRRMVSDENQPVDA
jgi:hypothetical protein